MITAALSGGLLAGCAPARAPDPEQISTASPAALDPKPAPAPAESPAQRTPTEQLILTEQLAPLSAAELTALLGPDADPELVAVVSGLQVLFNQEYRAVLALDAELLDPAHTDGWQFTAPNQIDFEGLTADGATVVGHEPSRITGLSEITQAPSGNWQVTAVMSQIKIEILGADGAVLLDTRDSGPFVATYELTRVSADGSK